MPTAPSIDTASSLLGRLVTSTRNMGVDLLEETLAREAAVSGLMDVRLYVVDHEQKVLQSLGHGEEATVDGSALGHAYVTAAQIVTGGDDGEQLFTPLLAGADRIGVMSARTADATAQVRTLCEEVADVVAGLLVVRGAYSDRFIRRKRVKPMSLAAEMQWQQLPPLAFAADRIAIAAILEPSYEIAGDGFDYSADDHMAHLALFDAMGHGLEACRLSTLTLAAYRHARRREVDLVDMYGELDTIVADTFGPEAFITGVLAEVNLASGRLRWLNAGHPPPLLLRDRKVVAELVQEPVLPFGFGGEPQVFEAALEPGDRLVLVTDGVVEARSADGTFFGTERVIDVVGRHASGGRQLSEQLRQLALEVSRHAEHELRDDATALICEWRGEQSDAQPDD
jgi:serine phosphatase RsbU (regulator of sigma subunit)